MPDDLQSTLDTIDQVAVDECSWCRATIPADAPSPDYCNADCQANWMQREQETIELIGYSEPTDIAAHAANQVEYSSPDTTPAVPEDACRCYFCQLRRTLGAAAAPATRSFAQTIREAMQREAGVTLGYRVADELARWQSTGRLDELPGGEPASVDPAEPVFLGMDFAAGSASPLAAAQRVGGHIVIRLLPDTARLTEWVAERFDWDLSTWQERFLADFARVRAASGRAWLNQVTPARQQQDEAVNQADDPMRRALELRRNRNTGPAPRRRPPRRINPPGGTW